VTPTVALSRKSAPAIASLAWVTDPTDPHFQAAMKVTCEVCGAKPGRPCWNTIDDAAPLPNRLLHHGRLPKSAA
jgi:hypothetical protein